MILVLRDILLQCVSIHTEVDVSNATDLLSLASDSGSEEVFCLLRTTLLPPSPAGGWPVAPGVTGIPGANRNIKGVH